MQHFKSGPSSLETQEEIAVRRKQILDLHAYGFTQTEIGKMFEIHKSRVSKIVRDDKLPFVSLRKFLRDSKNGVVLPVTKTLKPRMIKRAHRYKQP